jgi:hypothetical protein
MAGPWEQFATPSETTAQKPWEQFAKPEGRSVLGQLTGLDGGERYQTWPERAIREIAGAPKKLIDAAGSAEPGSSELSKNLVGPALETATIASPLKPGIAKSLAKPGAIPTAQELKAAGDAGYKEARGMGVDIKSDSVANMATSLGAKLEQDGINAKLAPNTFSIISELTTPPAGSVATIAGLETARRTLGNAAKQFTNPTEQMAASRAIEHLDDYLSGINAADVLAGDAAGAAKILSQARGNYGAAKRSERLTDELTIADRNADAANSGMNLGNATRQRVKSILNSDKKSSGYSDAELAQLEKVVRGTGPGNIARRIGNMLGGGGGLGTVVTAGVGGMVNPLLAGLPAVGYGMKKLGDASVSRQARIADELIRSRSPLAQSTAPGTQQAISDPKLAAIIRALMASQQQIPMQTPAIVPQQ